MLDVPIDSLHRPLTIVANDAGGANQLIAQLDCVENSDDLRIYMEGPAKSLWNKFFPDRPLCESLEKAFDGSKTLLTGTGWSSNLEHCARILAREQGIKSVVILDHWVNYEARFTRQHRMVLPDCIWVVDTYALEIASSLFADLEIKLVDDFFLKKNLSVVARTKELNLLLYIAEPVREAYGEITEFAALNYMIENLQKIGANENTKIVVRPHPSEPPNKYDKWISKVARYMVVLDSNADLAISVGQANWVVGLSSYGLVLALNADKQVFSAIPPNGPDLCLPHPGIVELRYI